jgi:hypothetical protein
MLNCMQSNRFKGFTGNDKGCGELKVTTEGTRA